MNVTQAPPKKWTILLYSAADNNLHPFMTDDVAELEKVGSDENTNLLVQFDNGRQGGPQGAYRYCLQKDRVDNGTIDTPPEESLGQVNMSSSETLKDAICWAMNKYPAEHTMLVISDHGNSWKGCCQDDSHRGWMDVPTLKNALERAARETGKKVDIVGFDCCMMGNTEVAYELRDQATYMVASEKSEGGDGWPYQAILQPDLLKTVQRELQTRVDMSPEELACRIVDQTSYVTDIIHTLSAVRLGEMGNLKEKLTPLRDAIVNGTVTQEVLRDINAKVQRFFGYRDLGDWLRLLQEDERIQDAAIKEEAARVQEAYSKAILAEQHDFSLNATGLTIHLTKPNDYYGYMALDFQKDSDWVAVGNKIGPP